MPKILADPNLLWGTDYFNLKTGPLIWGTIKDMWHLAFCEEEYYIPTKTDSGKYRQRGNRVGSYVLVTTCGRRMKPSEVLEQRELPEGSVCPLCKAFYSGLTFRKPREDKVTTKWRNKRDTEKAWFDQ